MPPGMYHSVILHRSFDAERVNAIVNHPEVRPLAGGDGKSWIDMTKAVGDPQNYTLLGPHGGFCFVWTAPDTYEVHAFILPEGRGKAAYRLGMMCRNYMESIGTLQLWARVGHGMGHVRHLAVTCGFSRCGTLTLDGCVYELYQWRKPCPQ